MRRCSAEKGIGSFEPFYFERAAAARRQRDQGRLHPGLRLGTEFSQGWFLRVPAAYPGEFLEPGIPAPRQQGAPHFVRGPGGPGAGAVPQLPDERSRACSRRARMGTISSFRLGEEPHRRADARRCRGDLRVGRGGDGSAVLRGFRRSGRGHPPRRRAGSMRRRFPISISARRLIVPASAAFGVAIAFEPT